MLEKSEVILIVLSPEQVFNAGNAACNGSKAKLARALPRHSQQAGGDF